MKLFALIDCNNFYVSCERVFKPQLNQKPVVVLSNNDGCIIARSNEAKQLGIGMGEPFFKVKEIIDKHQVSVFSSNYTLYGDMSRRVMETLCEFTPDMEIYSIDEAFLDLSGYANIDLDDYGRKIQSTVKQWTGMPVSIGIARTKTLAKIANHLAKKSQRACGVLNLAYSPWLEKALKAVPVEKIWGVGKSFAKLCASRNIETAFDLRNADLDWVKKHRGVMGLRTVLELRGESCIDLEQTAPAKKGICVSQSFCRKVTSLDEMKEAVATYTTRAAEKLRKEKKCAGAISVFVKTNLFKTNEQRYVNSHTIELPTHTQDTSTLIEHGFAALHLVYRDKCNYKKAGVILSQLANNENVQLNLFDTNDHTKSKHLMEAIDSINQQHASNTIGYASSGIEKPWIAKFNHRSQRYTTRWDELLCVK